MTTRATASAARVTLDDVARAVGYSKATVDRVIHDRGGVHERTRAIVLSAATQLGYAAEPGGAVRPAPQATIDFLLPADSNQFMRRLHDELLAQGRGRPDVAVRIHLVDGFDPGRLASKLAELRGATDAIGLVAIDHPLVRRALGEAVGRGVKLMTLVSDIHHVPKIGYVGIDNRAAGRLSGFLFSRFLPPGRRKVALLAGSVSYRGHEEREMGFRQVLSENRERLEIVGLAEVRDDDDLAYKATLEHLQRHPDLAGIYNIGAGSRGVAKALTEAGRADDVTFVGHDLTEDTRGYLASGIMDAVIDQNPRVEARDAIEQLARSVRGEAWTAHPLRIHVVFKENIPEERE